ncbi:hypothetical protein L083_5527 [Actinoplanes sp. N902-109]|nr:hypothetical protein L083_5527 [Actinoplanes sp. N902-109]
MLRVLFRPEAVMLPDQSRPVVAATLPVGADHITEIANRF